MSKYLFEGDYSNKSGNVKVKLFLVHFIDEGGIHFIYSPHLDLSGYGNTEADAKESFKIVFEDFVDYTLKKKTIGKVLKSLGWKLKGTMKRPKNIVAPSITSIIGKNDYVSEIFDKYPVNTFHQEVGIPTYA
ncbi:MAG: hypothetical protein GYB37_05850 [Algicola sp.]|nr:hypothetical protein [Algicola sp.]